MMEHAPHHGVSGEVEHLWKHNKPLFLVIVAGLVGVAYLLYRNGTSAAIAPPATSTTSASGLQGSVSNTYVTVNKTLAGTPAPIAPVVPPVPPAPTPKPKRPPLPKPKPKPKPRPQPPVTILKQKPPGVGGAPDPTGSTPLIPYGRFPAGQYPMGSSLTWMGQIYTVVPGAAGRIWGVPGQVSAAIAQNTTIPPKVLLYAPASYY